MKLKLSLSFIIERSRPEPEPERDIETGALIENRGAPTYIGFRAKEDDDE